MTPPRPTAGGGPWLKRGPALEADLDAAYAGLQRILREIGPCVVAFSGGVDSTFLLKAARDVMGDGVAGDGVVAVTAVSPSLAEAERREAAFLAALIGVRHVQVKTQELDDPGYARNDGRRCYFCKRELFAGLRDIAAAAGGRPILYGAILDDLADERPGMQAAAEAGARAPLLEAGLGKDAVRRLSRRLGLPTWDKPAMACLASRVPRGTPVTAASLALVERAEDAVRALGYRQFRVRLDGDGGARIELDGDGLARVVAAGPRERLIAAVRRAGFEAVVIDPRGYRGAGVPAPRPA